MRQALEIYRKSDTDFWVDAIKKEMKPFWLQFDILDKNNQEPIVSKRGD